MNAIMLERKGRPEVMVGKQVDVPRPGAGEVRIAVRASGVNFADLLQRLGLYGGAPPLPYIPGFEVAGSVDSVGEGVERLSVGDRVVALTRFGGYAEQVCAPASVALEIPTQLSFEEAAALPVNYLTAWICMFTMGNLRRGERVLIHAAAGGVGTAAVQLARIAGAEIFATAGSDEKVEFVRELGARHPMNYNTVDFVEEIRSRVGRRNIDLVLDGVGADTLRHGYDLLAPLGRLVSFGLSEAVSGPGRNLPKALRAWWRTPRFNPVNLIGRNVGVFGFHLAHLERRQELVAEAFAEILNLVVKGEIRPIIAHTFPLSGEGAAAAHRYMHERRNIGKVLLVT
jgi:NADPH:quinone reductase-like Zn-dependent oxidoreductase